VSKKLALKENEHVEQWSKSLKDVHGMETGESSMNSNDLSQKVLALS
jgi:hypothetical protein